jgi:hypothetical protein
MNSDQYSYPPNFYPAPNAPVIPSAKSYPGGMTPPLRLAQAFVPWQRMSQVFSPAEALAHGTIFPELVSPYKG